MAISVMGGASVAISAMWLEAVQGDPPIYYSGQQIRRLIQGIAPLEGVVLRADLNVSQRAQGTNFSVDVATGTATVLCDTIANGGMYLVWSDTVVNVPIAVPPPTGTRVDLIILRVHDRQSDGGAGYNGAIEVINGTVGQPAPPTPLAAIPLGEVIVTAGQATIATANLTDRRALNTLGDVPLWEVSGGDGFPVPNATGTVYSGFTVVDSIGMRAVTTSGVTVALGGRYVVTFSTRIRASTASSTGTAALAVAHRRSGTLIAQVGSQTPNISTGDILISAVTTLRVQPGDTVAATFYQTSGVTLSINDVYKETRFTGVWVGP